MGNSPNWVCAHPGKLACKELIFATMLAGLCAVWEYDLSYLPQCLEINNSCRDPFTLKHPCEAPYCESMVQFTQLQGTDFYHCWKCHSKVYISFEVIGQDEFRNSCFLALQNKCQVKWEIKNIFNSVSNHGLQEMCKNYDIFKILNVSKNFIVKLKSTLSMTENSFVICLPDSSLPT